MGLIEREGFWIRQEFAEQDLVIVRDIYANDAYWLELIAERLAEAKLIVDVGAHIGVFARKVREYAPYARIICVEACIDNLVALQANAETCGAEVFYGACAYDPRPLVLWNAVRSEVCESTGGSKVRSQDRQISDGDKRRYRWDGVALPKYTLEDLRQGDAIDLLKLDCEGSEFDILGNTTSRERIGFIVGEYHGRQKWDWLRSIRFPDWDYGHMSASGDLGNFHLRNPKW